MNLFLIIQNNYTVEQAKALIHLLQSQGLYCAMQRHSDVFYQAKAAPGSPAMLQQFRIYVQAMIGLFSEWLLQGKPGPHKQKTIDAMLRLFTFLAIEAKAFSRLKRHESFPVLQELLHSEPGLLLWERYSNYILIDYLKLKAYKKAAKKQMVAVNRANCREAYFIWCRFATDDYHTVHLDAFIEDLRKLMKGLGAGKYIGLLFSTDPPEFKIVVPKKYLLAYLAVFYELHRCGRILCRNNKGIFVHLQSHIEAPEGQTLPAWTEFGKWFQREMKNETTCKTTYTFIKDLLNKYNHH
jgi:hypothetical protein